MKKWGYGMKQYARRTASLLTVLMALSVGVNAGVIGGNFNAHARVDNPSPGVSDDGYEGQWVGLNTAGNQWFNDLTSAAFGDGGYKASDYATGAAPDATPGTLNDNLFYQDQTPAPEGLRISWSATSFDDHDGLGGEVYGIENRHEQMMAGFLESTGDGGVITLSGTGLDTAYGTDPYSIFLYIDGENGEATGGAQDITTYTATDGTTTYYGLDNSNFIDGVGGSNSYNRVMSTTPGDYVGGNFVLFEGLTGSTFDITLTGVGNGVVLNAFEIVADGFVLVPEPSSFALLALLGCAGGLIRRRRNS